MADGLVVRWQPLGGCSFHCRLGHHVWPDVRSASAGRDNPLRFEVNGREYLASGIALTFGTAVGCLVATISWLWAGKIDLLLTGLLALGTSSGTLTMFALEAWLTWAAQNSADRARARMERARYDAQAEAMRQWLERGPGAPPMTGRKLMVDGKETVWDFPADPHLEAWRETFRQFARWAAATKGATISRMVAEDGSRAFKHSFDWKQVSDAMASPELGFLHKRNGEATVPAEGWTWESILGYLESGAPFHPPARKPPHINPFPERATPPVARPERGQGGQSQS